MLAAKKFATLKNSDNAATTTPMMATTPSSFGGTFFEYYEKHEQAFKQLMKQRSDMFRKVEEKLNKASSEIAQFQVKNNQLMDRLKQLDTQLEAEKKAVLEKMAN